MSTLDYKNIECAVFDLDGTLLNTIKTINYYLNFALDKNGLGHIDEASCMSFVGDGAAMLIHRALAMLGADDEENFSAVFHDYNAAYDADPYYLTEVYDGIADMLAGLKNAGIKIAVLSNKPDFATRSAVAHFFGDTFSFVAGARPEVALKPNPDALLSILSQLNIDPTRAAYIGDSDQDILTARNASVSLSISVGWGFRSREHLLSFGPSYLIDHPMEIMKIMKTDVM